MASAAGATPGRPKRARMAEERKDMDEEVAVVATREVATVARNDAVKRLRGQKVSRTMKEVAIRKDWTVGAPTSFVEPSSRANLTGWIRDREFRTTFGTAGPPVVDADPASHTTASGHYEQFDMALGTPTTADVQSKVRKHVGQNNHSSFIATRYGLCRFRNRVALTQANGAFELIPWGAPTVFPSAWCDFSSAPVLRLGKGVHIKPTADHPHPYIGSGCIPVFFHDCPSPYSFPVPPITEGVDRFGPRVMSKFRELKIHIEPFSYTSQGAGFGTNLDNTKIRNMLRRNIDPKPWARVIIFKRRAGWQDSSIQHTLFPPLFPSVPIGSSLSESRTTGLSDVTVDTPCHGARVRYWPSSVPGSMFQILEDFVVDLLPDKLPDRGYFVSQGQVSDDVFGAYGTAGSSRSINSNAFDNGELHTPVDADGLPHHFRRTTITRQYRDNGRFISFEHTGMDPRSHEGVPPRNPNVRATFLEDAGTDPRVHPNGGTAEKNVELDLCQEELFVTVVTGAYLSLTTAVAQGNAEEYPGVQQFISTLDPRSVCGPALVSIETNWWYADAGIDGPPRDFKWVDAGGSEVQVQVAPRPTQTAL